jgi:hypothetical protein
MRSAERSLAERVAMRLMGIKEERLNLTSTTFTTISQVILVPGHYGELTVVHSSEGNGGGEVGLAWDDMPVVWRLFCPASRGITISKLDIDLEVENNLIVEFVARARGDGIFGIYSTAIHSDGGRNLHLSFHAP